MTQDSIKSTNRKIWETWDWEKRDIDLAKENSLSRERVRQIRALLGKPKTLSKSKFPKIIETYRNQLDGKSYVELSTALGCRLNTVYHIAKRFNIQVKKYAAMKKLPKELMNWRLPNVDLETIWKLHFNAAAQLRSRYNLPATAYNVRFGAIPENQQEYLAEIEAEKKKAEEYWKSKAKPEAEAEECIVSS